MLSLFCLSFASPKGMLKKGMRLDEFELSPMLEVSAGTPCWRYRPGQRRSLPCRMLSLALRPIPIYCWLMVS